jgi:hypothetical protein
MIDVEEGVEHGGEVFPLKPAELGQLRRPPLDLTTTSDDLGGPAGGGEDGAGEEVRVEERRKARVLEAQQGKQVQVLVHKK